MKKLYILFFTLLIACSSSLHGQDNFFVLTSSCHSNDNTVYVAGNAGRILKTDDGGVTWTTLNSGSPWDLYSIFFTNVNTGYAVGEASTILKTTDGGITWTLMTKPITLQLRSVYFVNENTGYAVGNNGTILKTIDAGLNWNTLWGNTSNLLNSIYFPTSEIGYIAGDWGTILKTTDGGKNWVTLQSETSTFFKSVYFTDAKTGYIAGDYGTVIKTDDGGKTWKLLSTGTTFDLNSICFLNDNLGYASGIYGIIAKTTDGGSTWTTLQIGTTATRLESVIVINDQTTYITGYTATEGGCWPNILKTADGGSEWIEMTRNNEPFNYLFSATEFTIEATDSYVGFFLYSNIEWTASCNESWLKLDSIHGMGDTTIILTASSNTDLQSRTAQIKFSGSNLTNTVNVTQLGKTNSISDIENTIAGIYPNPANHIITIKLNGVLNENVIAAIFDVNGQLKVQNQFHAQNLIQMDVSGLRKGIYILKVRSKDKSIIKKLIIQK